MLIIGLILLYVTIRAIWYLIPAIKSPPGIITNPEPPAISPEPKENRKAADRIQLLDMDIRHYTEQYEQLERIEPKNLKQEIAIEQRKYQVERKIAAAALEMERLQAPE